VRGAFFRAREDVQAAEDYFCSALTVPAGKCVRAGGKGEMHADTDDLGHGIVRWRATEEILVPVLDAPVRGSGCGEAGHGEAGSEHVLAETGVGILGIERVEE